MNFFDFVKNVQDVVLAGTNNFTTLGNYDHLDRIALDNIASWAANPFELRSLKLLHHSRANSEWIDELIQMIRKHVQMPPNNYIVIYGFSDEQTERLKLSINVSRNLCKQMIDFFGKGIGAHTELRPLLGKWIPDEFMNDETFAKLKAIYLTINDALSSRYIVIQQRDNPIFLKNATAGYVSDTFLRRDASSYGVDVVFKRALNIYIPLVYLKGSVRKDNGLQYPVILRDALTLIHEISHLCCNTDDVKISEIFDDKGPQDFGLGAHVKEFYGSKACSALNMENFSRGLQNADTLAMIALEFCLVLCWEKEQDQVLTL